jgi:hypothetical protein
MVSPLTYDTCQCQDDKKYDDVDDAFVGRKRMLGDLSRCFLCFYCVL